MTDVAAPSRRLRQALVIGGASLLVIAALLGLNRKILAREALTGWLRSKGVPAEAEVTSFGPSRFRARLRIGDPKTPDFTAADADVRYRLKGLGYEVVSVRLRRPVLRARLHGGQLSAGSLDPLIEEFRRKPPKPDAAKPTVTVDDGVLLLATDYGPMRFAVDAVVADNRLMRLTGSSAATRLRGHGMDLALAPTTFDIVSRGGRVKADVTARRITGQLGQAKLEDAALTLSLGAPYPDLVKRRDDGALLANLALSGRTLVLGQQRLRDVDLNAAFVGQTTGWIWSLVTTGQLSGELRAGGVDAGGASGGELRAALTMADLKWTRSGGDRVAGTLRLTGTADRLRAENLALSKLTAAVSGPIALGRDAGITLTGSAVGRGGWRGLGPPTGEDSAEVAALKRGLAAFRFAAPGVAFSVRSGAATFALPAELRILPDGGGQITARGQPGGAMRIAMSGGGLPEVEAEATRLRLTDGGFVADGRVRALASIGPIVEGRVDATGRLTFADGTTTFVAARCAEVAAKRLEFGENDVEALSGRLCPGQGPMLRMAGGSWSLGGRAEGVAARAPFLQAGVEGAKGLVTFGQSSERLHASAAIDGAAVRDLAPDRRFNPLAMAGHADLDHDIWTADLVLHLPSGAEVATARLTHRMSSGQGGVAIETGGLNFVDGGLQPDELSPLAQVVGSPASGHASFSGRFDWTAKGAASNGVLHVAGLDFVSPAGPVHGLTGDVAFSSLAPLVAEPGQTLRIARLDALVPVTNLTTTFGIRDESLHISGGVAELGGGRVVIESLEMPFAPGAPLTGVLRVEGVQLSDLVEASPFGDQVDLNAKVSGRLPFEAKANRVRIANGDLKAIQPGRLSIRREALTGMQTSKPKVDVAEKAGALAPPPDAITDMAYQAMENLAFDQLAAVINSRPDGRLAVLFDIKGRHDPPTRQRIKLTWMDLIRRNFFGRPLPLPSGTKVNLTLDSSLNLDELLADYAEYQRLRSSGPVQP